MTLPNLERSQRRSCEADFAPESIAATVLRETDHRIGNLLTILAGELRHELSEFRHPGIRRAVARHERRIVDFAELHHLLAAGVLDADVLGQDYLSRLLEVLSRSILSPLNVRCQVHLAHGAPSAEQCKWLGRIITELVINSAKHAFRGIYGGVVRVSLFSSGGSWLCTVFDNGVGISGSPLGTGSRIVTSLLRFLDGRITTCSGPGGTLISIRFPAMAEDWATGDANDNACG